MRQPLFKNYEMQLNENETLEDLLIDGLKIIQDKTLYRFSSDSVLLSKFASFKKGDVVADFCSGSGIVGIHYYALHKTVKKIYEFELQKCLSDLAEKTVEYNGLEGKIECVNLSLQEIPKEYNDFFSLILCNPPYKKLNGGERNPNDHIAVCRHEITITLEEIVEIAAKKLKNGGRLCMCQRTERLADVIYEMRKNNLEPVKLQFVTSGQSEKPYLFLIEGRKGIKPQFFVAENIKN